MAMAEEKAETAAGGSRLANHDKLAGSQMDRLKHRAAICAPERKASNSKTIPEEVNASFSSRSQVRRCTATGKLLGLVKCRQKGVGGLNAEERKEINRIENEDRGIESK